jgi:hypothetical protein
VEADVAGPDTDREQGRDAQAGHAPADGADALAYVFAYVDAATVDLDSHHGETITGNLMEKAW